MERIYFVMERVVHFDWERIRVIGASFSLRVCEKIKETAQKEFESFDGEYAEHWVKVVNITKSEEDVVYDKW